MAKFDKEKREEVQGRAAERGQAAGKPAKIGPAAKKTTQAAKPAKTAKPAKAAKTVIPPVEPPVAPQVSPQAAPQAERVKVKPVEIKAKPAPAPTEAQQPTWQQTVSDVTEMATDFAKAAVDKTKQTLAAHPELALAATVVAAKVALNPKAAAAISVGRKLWDAFKPKKP